jgi:hypothetical protein
MAEQLSEGGRFSLEQQARQARLEMLYQQSGRAERGHPMHGLYTGLSLEAPSAQVPGPSAPEPAAASPSQQAGMAEQQG